MGSTAENSVDNLTLLFDSIEVPERVSSAGGESTKLGRGRLKLTELLGGLEVHSESLQRVGTSRHSYPTSTFVCRLSISETNQCSGPRRGSRAKLRVHIEFVG